jgi:hypothetical protein
MECPHCHWKQIEIVTQNWVSVKPIGNQSYVHTKILPDFIQVYRCQMPSCKYSWLIESEVKS